MDKTELTLEYIYDLDPAVGELVETIMKSSQKTLDKLVQTQEELDYYKRKYGILMEAFYEVMDVPVCVDPE